MLKRAGQAGRGLGRLLHHPVRLIGTILLVLLIGLGAASWRLSRGPVELPFLASRIGAAASQLQPGLDVDIGHARLAWEGFYAGGAPLDLRLSGISLRTPKGTIIGVISRLRITLAPLALLRGRIAPIRVIARDNAIAIRPQPHSNAIKTLRAAATRLAEALRSAPAGNRLDLAQLRLIRIVHADITLDDQQAGLHLAAPQSAVTLRRAADGAITARARALFHGTANTASQTMPVAVDYDAVSGHGMLRAVIGPGNLSAILPRVKELAALHLPVTINAGLPFGQNQKTAQKTGAVALRIAFGQGSVAIAQGQVPVRAAGFALAVTSTQARLTHGEIYLGGAEASPPVIAVTGSASEAADGTGDIRAAVTARTGRVTAADLHVYWPEGLAWKTRKFVLNRIAAGIASDGIFHFGLALDAAANKIRLDRFDGNFNAAGVTFKWLKGMPPMTGLTGRLHFPDKDHLRIHADRGQIGGLAISKALVLIDGVAHKDQNAAITGEVAGPVPDVVAMLAAPRLHQGQNALPIQGAQLQGAQGTAQARIRLDIPIKKHLALKDMHLAALAHLTSFAVPLSFGRLALHDGDVRVQASFHKTSMTGTGVIGDQPARFSGQIMRTGTRRFALRVATRLDRALLSEAGYDSLDWGAGAAPLTIDLTGMPGQADATLQADLTQFAFALPALGWSKPAGAAGQASLGVTLQGGRTIIRRIKASAPGLIVAARGDGSVVSVQAFDIGRSRASGKITFPAHPGAPWLIALAGPVLDISGAVNQAANAQAARSGARAQDHAKPFPWRLRGAFDRLILRKRDPGAISALHLRAEGSGVRIAALRATALLAKSHHVEFSVAPARAGRVVRLATGDGGALLRAFGIADTITGGNLGVAADYNGGTLSGRATLTGFRLRHAPLIGKVLQGLTLYGLAEATSGPGLAFSRLVAPFTLAHRVLTIKDGRAYSASLGVTMAGQANFARKNYNLGGTIVPAYALNSLPGRIPVLGRLFRTGKGSGLFSARFTVDGPFSAPHIVVNPLAALAPGVLSGIFGSGPPDASKPPKPNVSVKKRP